MTSKEESKSFSFTNEEQWQLDEIIMSWWDALDLKAKKHAELDCYKLFKLTNFNEDFIPYLKINDANALADEMEHFMEIYHKVPHLHEKRKAA